MRIGGCAADAVVLGTPLALAEGLAAAIDEALARGADADAAADGAADAEAAADADAEGEGACSCTGPLAGAPIIARTRGSHLS